MNKAVKSTVLILFVISLLYSPPILSKEKSDDEKEGSFSIQGIEVIQNRLFQKAGRHELGLSFGILYDNPFVFYEMLPIQYTYHLRESIGFEATATFAFGQEKGLVKSLNQPPIGADVKVEKIKRFYTGNFLWSPIYGKFNIFANYIYHFDLFLTTGLGFMENSGPIEGTDQYHNVNHLTCNVGAGVKIYMNDRFVIRIDFRNLTWKEGAPFNDVVNSRILTAGAAFFFPTHKKVEK